MRHYCTYLDSNYLARGLALYRSLARHAGEFTLHVLCMDEGAFRALSSAGLPNLRAIALADFERGDERLRAAKAHRSAIEYYFTCTPSLSLYVMNGLPRGETVTYLDADLFFFADPAPIYAELGDGAVLIIPHRFPADAKGSEVYGIYNVGWVTFRNVEEGRACVTWWRERCLEWCHDRAEPGRFADQKYLDDWPQRFQRVVAAQHKGANLAPWNVSQYRLTAAGDGVCVEGQPLIFYHFHDLKVITPHLFEVGLRRYGLRLRGLLWRRIYRPYLLELQSCMRSQEENGRRRELRTGRSRIQRVLHGDNVAFVAGLKAPARVEPVMRLYFGAKQLLFTHVRRLIKRGEPV